LILANIIPAQQLNDRKTMNKRRLTKQQQNRINAKQNENLILANGSEQNQGLLIASYGKYADILTANNQIVRCTLRQNLPALVVGDEIIWQAEQAGLSVVTALIPRKSELFRINYQQEKKLIAANLNQAIIVMAVQPDFSEFVLDSYLAAMALCNLKAMVVFNKIDLLNSQQLEILHQRAKLYKEIGYEVYYLSCILEQGLSGLKTKLLDNISAFIGPSGVGKSTLIKQFVPEESIVLGVISEATNLGRHTTTTSHLYRLQTGGVLIDSPGIRGFGLGKLARQQLYHCFIDIKPYKDLCKFRNCEHESEPDCALQQAVKTGKISLSRLNSFKKLMAAE